MTIEEIKRGLQFTVDMFLFDPITGEVLAESRNDNDKTTIEACKGAIEFLDNVKAMREEIEKYRDSFVIAGRQDVVGVLDYTLCVFDKYMKAGE